MASTFDDLTEQIVRLAHPLVPKVGALAAFTQGCKQRMFGKGEQLARAGEIAETLFFVRNGILRYYYLADGSEHTGQFFTANTFVADVYSFTNGLPALQNIDALEAATVLAIPKAVLAKAYDEDHAFERFGRRLIEGAMTGAQRRTANLLMRTPEQRYADFVQARPELIQKVPQYIVASFLGVTPESLSRLRKRRLAETEKI